MDDTKFDARSWALLIALILAEATAGFEGSMIITALKTFMVEFQDPIAVNWLLSSYLLVAAASAAVCGRLGDIYGRRRVLMILLACGLVGSLISASSSQIEVIIFGRAIQGLTGAVLPLCFGLAREVLPESKLPYSISALACTAIISSGIGAMAGGFLVESGGYHTIFVCSAILAAASMVAVQFVIPLTGAPRAEGSFLKMAPGLMFVPGLFAIMLLCSYGTAWGWTSTNSLALGVTGIVILALWARRELNSANPLINLRLLSNRTIVLAAICAAFFGFGPNQAQVIMLLMQQPEWTGIGAGVSATQAGIYNSPGFLVTIFMASITGLVVAKLGGRGSMMLASLIFAFGYLIVIASPSWIPALIGAGIIMSLSAPIAYSSIPTVVVSASPPEMTSGITGMIQVIRTTFQAVGAQVIAAILAAERVPDPAGGPAIFPTPTMLYVTLILIVVCALGMSLCGFLLPRKAQGTQWDANSSEQAKA